MSIALVFYIVYTVLLLVSDYIKNQIFKWVLLVGVYGVALYKAHLMIQESVYNLYQVFALMFFPLLSLITSIIIMMIWDSIQSSFSGVKLPKLLTKKEKAHLSEYKLLTQNIDSLQEKVTALQKEFIKLKNPAKPWWSHHNFQEQMKAYDHYMQELNFQFKSSVVQLNEACFQCQNFLDAFEEKYRIHFVPVETHRKDLEKVFTQASNLTNDLSEWLKQTKLKRDDLKSEYHRNAQQRKEQRIDMHKKQVLLVKNAYEYALEELQTYVQYLSDLVSPGRPLSVTSLIAYLEAEGKTRLLEKLNHLQEEVTQSKQRLSQAENILASLEKEVGKPQAKTQRNLTNHQKKEFAAWNSYDVQNDVVFWVKYEYAIKAMKQKRMATIQVAH